MASPSPVPPYLRVVEPSACVNAWNSPRCASAEMPMPVSVTSKRSVTCDGAVADLRHAHDDFAVLGELHGVADQVGQHLAQRPGIAAQRRGHIAVDERRQLEPFRLRLLGQHVDRVLDRAAQVEIDLLEAQLPGLDLREVQDVVDDRQQRVAARLDRLGESRCVAASRCRAAGRSCR